MRISIFGLGYVGSVTAACFADWGHSVIGVDTDARKVESINAGRAPMVEPGLNEIIARTTDTGNLTATRDPEEAVLHTDISFICVGTPGNADGSLDYRFLEQASNNIGNALITKNDFHTIVTRSTILPGTLRDIVIPTIEKKTRRTLGTDFGVCHNPEFLREGHAIHDFNNPSRTVIGSTGKHSAHALEQLYSKLTSPIIHTSIETAEMVKYADNAWHATKVAFTNEIGKLCKASHIDSHDVMDIFCQDTKLNISGHYMKPGFAFGGSCLTKDVQALTSRATSHNLHVPLLSNLMSSNQAQVQRGIDMIEATGKKRIGILGLAFKAETDDLRCSPMLDVAEHLQNRGYELRIYDQNVKAEALVNGSRNLAPYMVNHIEDVLAHAEVIVIGNNAAEYARIVSWLRPEQRVIDFVRIKPIEEAHSNYDGICW